MTFYFFDMPVFLTQKKDWLERFVSLELSWGHTAADDGVRI